MKRAAGLCALFISLSGPAVAQEFAFSNGPLSDEDFYRAVACGARPGGGQCRKPQVHWTRQAPLRVSIRRMDDVYLGGKRIRAFAALERALQELNRADFGRRLVEVDENAPAEIKIYFPNLERGAAIEGTGIEGVDGSTLGGASVRVRANENGEILNAAIVFSTTLDISVYESVMLEELTQAMGLMTDIKNPYYDDKSIFSQDSNLSKTLGEQDIMALKRHYAERDGL